MKKTLLLLIGLTVSYWSLGTPIDSLRTETINGQLFVIHEVEPQETLFGLSRRYKVEVEEIKKYNPGIADGFRIGDIVRIPFIRQEVSKNSRKHIVKAGETLFSLSKVYEVPVDELRSYNKLANNHLSTGQELYIPQVKAEVKNTTKKIADPDKYLWHVVEKGETLYGLSIAYGADLEDMKRLNKNLKDNGISIGDSLIVGVKKSNGIVGNDINVIDGSEKEEQIEIVQKDEETTIAAQTEATKEEKSVYASNNNVGQVTKEVVKNDANFEEILETGLAELIENSGNSKKYLALHRTAKVGTIIRVHNEMNGQEVFVRVIGHLPDTGINDKVLIKISRAAYDRLSAIDKKFRVRISYFPD